VPMFTCGLFRSNFAFAMLRLFLGYQGRSPDCERALSV
jgi:hypothetical protein